MILSVINYSIALQKGRGTIFAQQKQSIIKNNYLAEIIVYKCNFAFTHVRKVKKAAKKGGRTICWKTGRWLSIYPYGPKLQFLRFTQKFKMVAKMVGERFLQTRAYNSAYTLQTTNLVHIALSCTIYKETFLVFYTEIQDGHQKTKTWSESLYLTKAFLCFKQKFMMATKNGRGTTIRENGQKILRIPSG